MGNHLEMADRHRILALLELGWSYRRMQRETGVHRDTVARYDPRRAVQATQSGNPAALETVTGDVNDH